MKKYQKKLNSNEKMKRFQNEYHKAMKYKKNDMIYNIISIHFSLLIYRKYKVFTKLWYKILKFKN